ncbi:S-adenosyl-L-methionine-dependent methyltransferase [Cercophora newfieldiana]|uniref:S-adenosyl-L-methionine-dependent methyltransferase n=1 Tax=Cercophora newfieldiana TaxID=92897 RepID=A0AA40CSI5_9PEZI|nr:S-adenosyl-L-methionine-dependent methyltransferase [Cercophora newfieldiana]
MTDGREATFRAFTGKQGSNYAQQRRDYHSRLYNAVTEHHVSTGGQFGTLLDVGCGPGIAVRRLAPLFDHAIAIDPSEGMIESALAIPNTSAKSGPIRFAVSSAETLGSDLSPAVPEASVDLLTAATAAHWFDVPKFWNRAARVVKPGGTVALWCGGFLYIKPTTPNHERIQAAIDKLEVLVDEYVVSGNRIARGAYVDLPLPWTVEPAVPEFERASFVRREWGQGEGREPGDEFYNTHEMTVDMLVMVMGTASPVIRWREANPEKAGTEEDPLKVMKREIEAAFEDAGVEGGERVLKGGVQGALLLVKRK